MNKLIVYILIINVLLLSFPVQYSFAQPQNQPETIEEAKSVGLDILKQLPGEMKDVWQYEAAPILLNTFDWIKGLLDSTFGHKIEMWWKKFLKMLGKEMPKVEGEFQKEKQEMKKDLWERLKELIK